MYIILLPIFKHLFYLNLFFFFYLNIKFIEILILLYIIHK